MRLMKFKVWFFIFSVLIILPGLFFLVSSGLKLGIDFTGGNETEYKFAGPIRQSTLAQFGVVTPSGENVYLLKTKHLEQGEIADLDRQVAEKVGKFTILSRSDIGPVIGNELKQRAVIGLILASVAIVAYITWSFRKVPKPASSFRFGVVAIIALIHDVLVVAGLFAIFGKFWGVEVDTLFVTALLTVIGFSVHDTIVVFDRIRENLPKNLSKTFEEVADISVTQTLARSLNTSLTVVFVLLALLLFGGGSIRWFVVALLIGIVSGTYSSIFNATALLCLWEDKRRRKPS